MKKQEVIEMNANCVIRLSVLLALLLLASPAMAQLDQSAGEDMKTLLGRALKLTVSPWENPSLIPLRELMRKDPDGVVRAVEEVIGGGELEDADAEIVV